MQYFVSNRDGKLTFTFTSDDGDPVETVSAGHINFEKIRAHVMDAMATGASVDEDMLNKLLKPVDEIAERLSRVSKRFTHQGGQLMFDGGVVFGLLATQIVRVIRETDMDTPEGRKSAKAVARFGEKLMANPSMKSREHLLNWLQDRDLTITDDGNFIAYKGVAKNADGEFVSVHHGPADLVKVNGIFQPAGPVPNPIGAVVTMERRNVNDNTNEGCSQGLHAGTYSYARDWGKGGLLLVAIDPGDVVSVPRDCSYQKIRVSKYKVLEITEYEYTAAIWSGTDCDDDTCCDCGEYDDYCECEDRCEDCGELWRDCEC